jgi:predicted Zn finger-like uncharacterized protein
MITHCPFCHTHFRVHSEQLAARAGQVRCGKCSRVFNALEHLIDELAPAYASRPADDIVQAPAGASPMEAGAEQVVAVDFDSAIEERANAEAADAASGKTQVVAIVADADRKAEESLPADGRITPDAAASAIPFEFGPTASADPAKRARSWPWLLGALLLLALLLAQTAYYFRGPVTLLFPEAKPYAAALCAKLGCDLPLPRRVDLMSIDASDLQADTTNRDLMVLTATIKNRAIFSQQHPFLELTLTDGQDQPLVRRVLAPLDYAGKGFNPQAGVAPNGEIAVKVIIEGSQVKATGYRLYLFYP